MNRTRRTAALCLISLFSIALSACCEDDTNAFAQRSFEVLGEEAGAELVDGLRRLPSAAA